MAELSPRGTPQKGVSRRTGSGTASGLPVVGIGASAGGLEAFQKLFDAQPSDSGMAFILVQHLDPAHPSMMVELLAKHTAMTVRQAEDGMRIESDCVYVIPPGAYLSLREGALRLSKPWDRHGARFAFDFLLNSLAEEAGARAACVVLSGTGADGSAGLKAVKEACGLVIAQDPAEAGFDGMPKNAILTGAVDLVLPLADIPQALTGYFRHLGQKPTRAADDRPQLTRRDMVSEIIDLLHADTEHDFSLYKQGTLRRRIERRMALASIKADDMGNYLDILKTDRRERDLLVKDLLINVTSFFRDPETFNAIAEKVVPDLLRGHSRDNPVRIWSVGCSTGEEAYSLIMLFLEHIEDSRQRVGLQVFASDIDADAIAIAREGLYPDTIESNVSPERLARFFTKEDECYRISPDMRQAVVFTPHDMLTDPPFSRIDLISCRNLLIYFKPEAQAKAASLFHFALREGGVLLLGNAESISGDDDRFERMPGKASIYRHLVRRRPGALGLSGVGATAGLRSPGQTKAKEEPSRQDSFADLCQRLLLEGHMPAAVLINRQYECLYTRGPVDKYLRVVSGHPSNDIFVMVREDVRSKLRAVVQRAIKTGQRIDYAGGAVNRDGQTHVFDIEVQPVSHKGEDLLFICFIDRQQQAAMRGQAVSPIEASKITELEKELEETRAELSEAMRNLEDQARAQKEINEEALSTNEEFQAANEELETSKEELQSLNEELAALNNQLQETLDRERTAANDLQNVLYSTDVATLFLDVDLNIRFFTPATRSLFHIIPGDIGRPLSDLRSLAGDSTLLEDARSVLHSRSHAPIEREITAEGGGWFIRCILPYRTLDDAISGVVITYTDNTEQRRAREALEEARRQAEQANIAKSRFLAAASHDLRQPLATLVLLQGMLEKTKQDESVQKLIALLGQATVAMSGMLNTLLDINQLDTGTVRVEPASFRVVDLLKRLREEFTYDARAQGIELRVIPCSLSVRSDPHLLQQMIRNLLSNALKYTRKGKVLLGCRRHQSSLIIEVWDTGIGIASGELEQIFNEYYQIDNAARERSQGLGLGLSIVKRLGHLLNHHVSVRSWQGRGSVFSVEVPLTPEPTTSHQMPSPAVAGKVPSKGMQETGSILIIEDNPDLRKLLKLSIRAEGHHAVTASNGKAALKLVTEGAVNPGLILADYNLPEGLNGLETVAKIREILHHRVPAIILTGDISTDALSKIAAKGDLQLNKPVKGQQLAQAIQRLLVEAKPPEGNGVVLRSAKAATPGVRPVVYIVDDDSYFRMTLRTILESEGFAVDDHASCEAFLKAYRPGRDVCLLVDAYLPGMTGLELLARLNDSADKLPAIMITGFSDVAMAVHAMKVGAMDFIEKPVNHDKLLESVHRVLNYSRDSVKLSQWKDNAASVISRLTERQRQTMDMVLAGHPNKNIAADLGISQRTVENHRAAIMKKTGSESLPALVRLATAAERPASRLTGE